MKTVEILGVEVDAIRASELMVALREHIDRRRRTHVVTVNNEIIMRARDDAGYRKLIRAADFRIPDSTGVIWAAYFLNRRLRGPLKRPRLYLRTLTTLVRLAVRPAGIRKVIPETVPGSDLVDDLAAMAEEFGYRLYLLGGIPGAAAAAAAVLQQRYPGLEIVGAEPGNPEAREDRSVRKRIDAAKPHILLVAYGAPKQERWIARNLPKLRKPALAVGVGGTFDYLAGTAAVTGGRPAQSPPPLVRSRGFEWLWRLVIQPHRWRRIYTALPLFVRAVLAQKLSETRQRRSG